MQHREILLMHLMQHLKLLANTNQPLNQWWIKVEEVVNQVKV